MALALGFISAIAASAFGVPLDTVDIGKEASEAGHNIIGWGPIEPANSGGNYGGIDDCRAVYSSHDGNRWASVELDFGSDMLSGKCLTLHHLDGLCCDSFQAFLYPKGRPDQAEMIYSYEGDNLTTEIWYVSKIQVSGWGTQVLKLESMSPEWSGFDTYGQMCFDIIQVDESPEIFDLVDVGNEASEAGHNLLDWGPVEPETSGGHYGGADDCRAVYAPEDGNRWATLEMDFGECFGQKCLTFQHLEGIANDAFELYVYPVGEPCPEDPVFDYPGDECTTECWMTSGVVVEATGPNTLKFVSTEEEWSGWGTYGQVCIDTIIAQPYTPLKDAEDIGDEASEMGHDLQG